MKTHGLFLFLIISLGTTSQTSFFDSYAVERSQDNQKVKITISYSNDTSKTYTILAKIDQNYTILQEYSWTNNKWSRFSLQAYAVDNSPFVPIQRTSEGNFTLELLADHDKSIIFLAKPQFKIIISGTNQIIYLPSSPTNDNWFDEDSQIQITIPRILQLNQENIRQQLNGWSLDGSYLNVISRQESGVFKSPIIHMSNTHEIYLDYKTQYYIKAISDFGRIFGSGWYDAGTIVNLSVIPTDEIIIRHFFAGWQGSIIGNGNQDSVNVLSDSPKIIVANWRVDYTNVSIIGVIVIAVMVSLIIYQKRKS